MSNPTVPPSAPSFVAETIAMLGARFDNLSAADQERVMGVGRISELARVPGQSPREAFVAAMLDTTLRSAAVAASYYALPIGPAHETVAVVVGATPGGRSVIVVRHATVAGRVTWEARIASKVRAGEWRNDGAYSTKVRAVKEGERMLRAAAKLEATVR